jgi:hypothetical protein
MQSLQFRGSRQTGNPDRDDDPLPVKKKNAAEQLLGHIRRLFLDRGLYHKYGISLLHKHFPIQATERLVDYHHVASPWMVGSETALVIPRYEGAIVPRTFRFFGGRVTPYEFSFSATTPLTDKYEGFL